MSQSLGGGTLVYQTTLVGGGDPPHGFELALLRHNLAMQRTVRFARGSARSDEVNADYGVRSPCVRLYRAGGATLYAKALHRVRFCIELPPPPELGGREGEPELVPDGETVVAGVRCRRALYRDSGRQLAIAYADDLTVDDPTGAVVQLAGVPGLVMAWEELPRPGAHWWLSVAISELSRDPTGPLALPDGYTQFASVDQARAEDRRMIEAEAPPSSDAFSGRWRWEGGDVELDIAPSRLRTIAPSGTRDEAAARHGSLLVVEDTPNLRLYQLDDRGRLVLADDDGFRFVRI